MAGIIQGIKEFFDFIVRAVQFLFSLIKDLVRVVEYLGQVAGKIPSYLGFLPSAALAIVVTMVSIMIVYKIVGRD